MHRKTECRRQNKKALTAALGESKEKIEKKLREIQERQGANQGKRRTSPWSADSPKKKKEGQRKPCRTVTKRGGGKQLVRRRKGNDLMRWKVGGYLRRLAEHRLT